MDKVYKIYLITNKVNGKRYVGITEKSVGQRYAQHWTNARNNSTCAIHKAMRKYGEENFFVNQIDEATTWENGCALEREYIIKFGTHTSTKNGYNQTYGGDGSVGFKHSEETLAAIRKRVADNIDVYRERLAKARMLTPPMSEREKARRSIAMSGENNPFYGKTHTQESVAIIRAANIGRKQPQSAIDKHRERMTGATLPDYWCDAISRGLKGKKKSPEHFSAVMASRVVNGGSAKAIVINGVLYETMAEAGRCLGLTKMVIKGMVNRGVAEIVDASAVCIIKYKELYLRKAAA